MSNVWPTTPIGELAEKIAMGPFGSSIKVETFVPEGVPVISGAHLHGTRVKDGEFNFVTPEHAEKLKNANVYRGDVIFTHAGNIGQVAFIPENSKYDRYVISQRQFYLRCDTRKLLPAFVAYFFKTHEGKHRLLANASQVGVPSIARPSTYLRTIPIPLPTLSEQHSIVEILESFDDKIELNRRMNETLEAMARAIFKSWFVYFDPVRAKASGEPPESICRRLGLTPELLALFPDGFQDSELGDIPEGWCISTLAVEAKRCGGFVQTGPFGSQLHAADYVPEGVPVVMPQDLVNRRISVERIVRVTIDMAQRLSRHALEPGDVVYSRRGDVERHALVSDREAGWLCGTGCLLVRLGVAWPSQAYLSEVLDLPVTREWLVRHAVGATMPNLNTSILGSMPLLLPPESALSAFEAIAGPLRKQQIAASIESDSLASVRNTLLPKLLSGDSCVPDGATIAKVMHEASR